MMRNYVQAYRDAISAGFAKDIDIQKHVEQQTVIDRLLPDSASFFYVVEVPVNKYHFLGRQQESVSGYTNEEFLREGVEKFIECIHPEDTDTILGQVYPTIGDIAASYSMDDKKKLQIQYNYRFIRKNGESIDLMEQIHFLELNEEGFPSLFLGNVIILNNTERLPIRLTCKLISESGLTETVYTRIFNSSPNAIDTVTKRELDILRGLSLGKSSREIAEEFCISKHTVDTHRRNLLRKLDCKSVVELAQIAFSNGLM